MLRAAKNLFGMQRVWRRRAHAPRCVASVSQAEGFQKICSNFDAACGMANPIKASHLWPDETLLFLPLFQQNIFIDGISAVAPRATQPFQEKDGALIWQLSGSISSRRVPLALFIALPSDSLCLYGSSGC